MPEEILAVWVLLWCVCFAGVYLALGKAYEKDLAAATKLFRLAVAMLMVFILSVLFFGALRYGWFGWFK